MAALLLVIVPIALLDSASMIPISVAPMAVMLGGRKPVTTTGGFLLGVFVTYVAGGVGLLFGVQALLERLAPGLERWYYEPNDVELGIQLVLGLVMLAFGWWLANSRTSHGERGAGQVGFTPWQAFALGATLVIVGLPGAVPYFGAVDQILRADLTSGGALLAVLAYNVAFIVPPASLLVVRLVAANESDRIFKKIVDLADRWGKRLIIAVLLIVGAFFAADAIGWYFDSPLLPVGERPEG
jgi:hypothetical protein